MGQWGLRPREFIPEWNDNRQQPEAGKIVMFYKGYTVDEQAEIRRVKARMGRKVSRVMIGYKKKFADLERRIDATQAEALEADESEEAAFEAAADALLEEVDGLLDEQAARLKEVTEPFYRLAAKRITAVEQGPGNRADTPEDVWHMLSQAWDLMAEIAGEILTSGDVKTAEDPTSGPPSTGD